MEDDKLGDWRIRAVTTLAEDAASLYDVHTVHRAGTPIYLTTMTQDARRNIIGFVTPSPAALALDLAINAVANAKRIIKGLEFGDVSTPIGAGKSVAATSLRELYDYFEQCMIDVTFSFQALEAYSNEQIADKLSHPYSLDRQHGTREMQAEELQRVATTEEKLGKILPDILGKESPRGRKVWHQFKKLKNIRDTTVHLKSQDAYRRFEVDRDSLFYQFFHGHIEVYPRFAFEMMDFFENDRQRPRWLESARDKITRIQHA